MSELARVNIAHTNIEIAPLALGGNVFGWTADHDDSFAVLDGFVAGGGNFIDTADSYSRWVPGNHGGESERIIGKWMHARGSRDDVVIATKVFSHPEFQGLAPDNVRAALTESLDRLDTDYVDLYYAHHDDAEVPLIEVAAVFSQLVDEGQIRAIGVSNFSAERLNEWIRLAREHGYHLPVAMQPHYSLVERDFETNGLREVAEAEGLAVFPYYALASGFLAGKYRESSDGVAEGASPRAAAASKYLDERGKALLEALDNIAYAHDVEVASVALAWLRQQPTVAAPIASARNVAQLPALLASMSLELSGAELSALGAI
ncbi:MAG: aldo/keto reductase [Leucobacter sp.]|nr:aldo/keto reductase [Leucobacter sp.]